MWRKFLDSLKNNQRVLVYYVTLSLVTSLWRRCFSLKNQADNANWLIIMRNLALKSARWIEMQAPQADTFLQYYCEWPNSYTTSGEFFPCTPWTYHYGPAHEKSEVSGTSFSNLKWKGLHKEQQIFSHVERKYIPLVKSRATSFNPGVVERAPMAAILLVLLFVWPVLAAAPSLHVTAVAWRSVKPWSLCGGDYWIIPFAEFSFSLKKLKMFPYFRSSGSTTPTLTPRCFLYQRGNFFGLPREKSQVPAFESKTGRLGEHISSEKRTLPFCRTFMDILHYSTFLSLRQSEEKCVFFGFFLRVTWQLFCRKDRFAMMPLYSPAVLALRKIQDQFPTGVVHLGRLVVK